MGKIYFGPEVDKAIIEFNSASCDVDRHRIYTTRIHTAVSKLVENVIHTYKFTRYDTNYTDLKHDTVAYLYERLQNISTSNGKAFSYCTVVARNYLIVRNTESYNTTLNKEEVDVIDDNRNIVLEVTASERKQLITEFTRLWADWGLEYLSVIFLIERERRIANAVFDIFKRAEEVDTYNKKALYILIREHADVRTQYITKVVNRLKTMFKTMCDDFIKNGMIDWDFYLAEYKDEFEEYDYDG